MSDQERIAQLEETVEKLRKKHSESTLFVFMLEHNLEFIRVNNPSLTWPTDSDTAQIHKRAIEKMKLHGYKFELNDFT